MKFKLLVVLYVIVSMVSIIGLYKKLEYYNYWMIIKRLRDEKQEFYLNELLKDKGIEYK